MATDQKTLALIEKGAEITGFDPRKLSKRTIRVLLYGGIIGTILWFWHGDIVAMMNDSVEIIKLGIYSLISGIVFWALWKQAGNFSDMLSRTFLRWMIDYDPWSLQYKQIDQTEADLEHMISEKEIISGQYAKLSGNITQKQQERLEAIEAAKEGRRQLAARQTGLDALSEEGKLQLQQVIADKEQEAVDCQTYIANIEPLVGDMKEILKIVDQGSIVLRHKIKRARASLATLKDTFDSASAGAAALTRMRKALTGNAVLNDQAEQSKMKVLQDISFSIGQIRTSVGIIGELTMTANLNDSAKMAVAKQQLLELGITSDTQAIPIDAYQSTNLKGLATVGDSRLVQLPD